MAVQQRIRIKDDLPEVLAGTSLEEALERMLTIAALVGMRSSDDYLISFTSLLIGLLVARDRESLWFQKYCEAAGVRASQIFESRQIDPQDADALNAQAESGEIEPGKKLWTISAEKMLGTARRMQEQAAPMAERSSTPKLGVRHLLAALAFDPPPGHDRQISEWSLQPQRLRAAFAREARNFRGENWSFLELAELEEPEPPGGATEASAQGRPQEEATGSLEAEGNIGAKSSATSPEKTVEEAVRALALARLDGDQAVAGAPDHLDVEREANAFARVAASRHTQPPLAIGVFGEWGSGKTFFMEKMRAHIDVLQAVASESATTAYHDKVVQIRFNAWHYMEKNLWASLVDYIFRELDNWLQPKVDDPRKIDELFEKLSTARVLKLEAVGELIEARRRRKDAEKSLEKARKQMEKDRVQAATATAGEFWEAVRKTFKNTDQRALERTRNEIQDAARSLGFDRAARSARDLTEALMAAAEQGRRGHLLLRGILQRLGDPRWLATGAALLFGVPASVVFLTTELPALKNLPGIDDISAAVLAFSSAATVVTGWVGAAVHRGSLALNRLAVFQDELDEQLQKRDRATPDPILQAAQALALREQEVEIAEADVERADERVQKIRDEFSDTARGRLNRFIRDKISNGDYARHLGIIATIRRDFDQLARMMADVDTENRVESEYESDRRAYIKKVAALELDKKVEDGLLLEEEKDSIVREPGRPDENLRFFQRIILYIDDLDRCPPDKVVEVLQACHLLLCFPLFVVVVAVDARWVSRSLIERYEGLLDGDAPKEASGEADPRQSPRVGESASPRDYLEKIFQVPYWVRRMRGDASKKYVAELVEPLAAARDMPEDDMQVGAERGGPAASALDAGEPARPTAASGTGQQPTLEDDHGEGESPQGTGPSPSEEPDRAIEPQRTTGSRGTGADEEATGREPVDPNPQTLVLSAKERELIRELAPFAGQSPRTLKRFVNVYRLLRTSLEDETFASLMENDGDSPTCYAILCQLAIVTGAPALADRYFTVVDPPRPRRQGAAKDLDALIRELKGDATLHESAQWPAIEGALLVLKARFDDARILEALTAHANLVRRYSFSARPYL